jgi:hypothetical protein
MGEGKSHAIEDGVMARNRFKGFAADGPVIFSALALVLVAAAIVFGWRRGKKEK